MVRCNGPGWSEVAANSGQYIRLSPRHLLETADTYKKIGAKSMMQVSGGSHDQTRAECHRHRCSCPRHLGSSSGPSTFVLFKKPVATNENGDIGTSLGTSCIRDARSGATISESSHIHMSLSKAHLFGFSGPKRTHGT
jgi:hypothetical protein